MGGGTSGHGNREVRRYLASHGLAAIAEWAALIGLLVYVFDASGTAAVGYASLAALAPYLLLSSATSRVAQRHRPASARWCGLIVQVAGYGLAAVCVLARGPVWLAVFAVAVAFTGVTSLRPAGAVLLPALVRTSRELTGANVWVGRCESAAVLAGPLVATALLGLGSTDMHGGGLVLAGCAAMSLFAALIAATGVRRGPPAATPDDDGEPSGRGLVARALATLASPLAGVAQVARRPGASGVLAAAMGQYVMIGAFDIILVVVAGEHLDLGSAGAGILTTFFGAGAFLSITLAGHAGRQRLAPLIVLALAVIAAACIAFGLSITFAMALVVLPVLGASRSLLDLMARVLLQRSAPPSQLAGVFGSLETASGMGLLVGSLLAQGLIAVSGTGAALVGVGALYALLAAALITPLRTADGAADVPVVAMSLLHQLPVFAPLPVFALEAVARSAVELPFDAGAEVIRQGEQGDRFYAVADGAFDVVMTGTFVRTARRGDSFGEVALLADVPRTATVTSTQPGHLLVIERTPFLVAVTGYDSSQQAAWGVVNAMNLDRAIAPQPTKRE